MKLSIVPTNNFKKDIQKCKKRGYDLRKAYKIIEQLSQQLPLAPKHRDHALVNSKNYYNCRECHIEPDWLLVYRIDGDKLILELLRTGTHSDLF